MSSTFSKEYTTEAIILRKKKGATAASFPYITPKGELRYGFVENRRLNSLKNGGYLQPFSIVHITLNEKKDFARITQVDGKHMLSTLNDLKNISYLAYASELIYKLFQHSPGNYRLYKILKQFVKMVDKKPLPIGTVILAWQLLALAGFLPDSKHFSEGQDELKNELQRTVNKKVSKELIIGIKSCMNYSWTNNDVVKMSAENWEHLEELLYMYSQYQIEEPLQSVNFIKQMRYTLFSD